MAKLLLVLMLLTASPLWAASSVSVLYKRSSEQSAERTDTVVQTALITFEQELIDAGVEVIAPDAATYQVLDRAPGSIVTFSPDSGVSLLVDAVKTSRPSPGTDNAFAEVRMRARLFQGHRVLVALTGSGQVGYRIGSEDKAFEVAAQRAARQISAALLVRLDTVPAASPAAKVEVDASMPVAPALPKPGKTHAILVGVSDFSTVRKLNPGAQVHDLKAMGDVLLMKKTLKEMGLPDGQVVVLGDKDATTSALRLALTTLKAGPEDLVVFYIASHGMPKNEGITGFGYPVMYDTKLNDKNSIIDFEEIRSLLIALSARRVLWIADTCHSGGAALGLPVVEVSSRAVRLKPVRGFSTRAAAMNVENHDFAMLSSAREDQYSLEDGDNGLFTVQLVKGLKATSGKVTVHGLYKDYLETQVPARVREICAKVTCEEGTAQQPSFASVGHGDAIIF